MRHIFPSIVANKSLCTRLAGEILNGSFPHAYIIEGAEGTGKHTLARLIAAALSCERRDEDVQDFPCGTCRSCRKILSDNSTDVILKGREDKATLGVDAIREMRQEVCFAPNDGNARVFIIEDAHLMTPQAQNAFLLTLEEPPPYVVFLLLCESAAALLETIRSRAPTLRTEPIEPQQIGDYLCRTRSDAATLKATAPSEFSEILAAANGSIGRAIALLEPKMRNPILEKRQAARNFARLCAEHRSTAEALRLLNTIGQKRDSFSEHLQVILLCLRDLLLCKQVESAPLCFFADREEACALAYRFTTPELLRLCRAVSDADEQLHRNANIRLTVTALAVSAGLI